MAAYLAASIKLCGFYQKAAQFWNWALEPNAFKTRRNGRAEAHLVPPGWILASCRLAKNIKHLIIQRAAMPQRAPLKLALDRGIEVPDYQFGHFTSC
jgi:hypothetical protein